LILPAHTYQTDTDLVKAFAAGDPSAEKQLFLQYFKPLCAYGERIVDNLQQAEDIATEIFLKLFDRKEHFSTIETIRAFLFRSVRNACIKFISREQNRLRIRRIIATQLVTEEDAGTELDHERARAQALHEIYLEMEHLPRKCGEIFKMLFIDQKTTEEVAHHFDIHVQTVRSQKARAIQLLRSALRDKHQGASVLLLLTWAATH
jgi:RNA polymerase sigma factor (sigma-70 family)